MYIFEKIVNKPEKPSGEFIKVIIIIIIIIITTASYNTILAVTT